MNRLIIIVAFILMVGCNSSIENFKIEGTWKVVEFIPSNNIDISPEIMGGGKEIAMSQEYQFKDSICVINNAFLNSVDTSAFNINNETEAITFLNAATGITTLYEMDFINVNKLKWTMSMGPDMGTIVLILKRK